VAIAPADKRAMNNLAIALGYQGKHEQALAMFRRVVPEAQAQANLAYLHVQRGEGKLAVQRYTRAVDLDKNLRSAAHALLQLAEMEQRYLESERGRQQVARLKKKLDAKKPVAESSRSKPERQGLQIVAASGTNPSAAKQAGPTTQASPTTATSALSKYISISSRREVVKRPATPTPSVNAEPKPATKGTPAASDPWSRVARQEQRQEPKPDPVRPVVHETTAPFAPPRGIAAPSGQRRPAARPVSNDSAPLSIVPDARTHRPPAFPETQRVQEPMPEVQPRRQVATTDEVQPSKQPGKPVARPFSKIAQPSEAPAARPEPKPPTQSWMPSQQRRRLTRWHTSQRGDSAAADADAANPRPFVGVRSDRLQPVEGALKKPAAASRYEPPATSTGRVKLVPAASPEPARIRLQPAAGPPASGRVRLTPDEPRS
jgi:hypothetical protein